MAGRSRRMVGLIGLIVFICGVCLAYSSSDIAGEMRFFRQMVGRDASERTIVWQSDAINENTVLEYRRYGETEAVSVRPMIEWCDADGVSFFRYQAELTELSRGAVYEYRVAENEQPSKWMRLLTEDDEYTALLFTDSQCRGDYQTWQEVVRAASEREEGVQLCLHLGDLVDCGASYYQWNRWLIGAEEILASCAFAPTMGNHEDYTSDWQMTMPHFYRALFPVPKTDERELDGHVYSFDYGEVHYVVLDTQAEELSSWKSDWIIRQAEWLRQDLAETSARRKIVLCHKPFYEIDGSITEHGKAWLPICRAYGVQLVLSGHHHIYARAVIDGITMITAGVSGDGTGYMPQENQHNIIAQRCDVPNYLTLSVTSDMLRVRVIQVGGEVIDEVTIP